MPFILIFLIPTMDLELFIARAGIVFSILAIIIQTLLLLDRSRRSRK